MNEKRKLIQLMLDPQDMMAILFLKGIGHPADQSREQELKVAFFSLNKRS